LRVIYFGNNHVGLDVLRWLVDQKDELVGLVIHPVETARFSDELIATSCLTDDKVISASSLSEHKVVQKLVGLRPDIGLSTYFGYILKKPVIDIFPHGIVNLHPGLLPIGRGSNTNVWSIVDETPAGVTLHYINESVDAGDIICKDEVQIEPTDTGESLYRKLESAAVELLKRTWPVISVADVGRTPQSSSASTEHRRSDVENIDEIDLDKTYTGRKLINILRARTFPPYRGAFFRHGHEKIYMQLRLLRESELDEKAE